MTASIWQNCMTRLEGELSEQQFNTWIRPLRAVEENGTLKLFAPNRFVVDWIEEHFVDRISEVVSLVSNDPPRLIIDVGSRATDHTVAAGSPKAPTMPRFGGRLNPNYTFDTFIEGESNQLARAAATQVGENPGKAYNPLFIYGGVGLGKLR
ncbi:MAG: DnaA N-terminal domain-containing protein [Pseudomonadota bacterium]